MTAKRFIILMVLLVFMQLILAKFCQGLPFMYICLLPAMILCMPTSAPNWWICTVAFIIGMLTDCLADGIPGLNASALLVVAMLQKPAIRIFIDDNLVERGYAFSFHQNGYFKIAFALTALTLVFFTVYVILDSAGTRSFGFNISKLLISSLSSIIAGMVVCGVLCPRIRR